MVHQRNNEPNGIEKRNSQRVNIHVRCTMERVAITIELFCFCATVANSLAIDLNCIKLYFKVDIIHFIVYFVAVAVVVHLFYYYDCVNGLQLLMFSEKSVCKQKKRWVWINRHENSWWWINFNFQFWIFFWNFVLVSLVITESSRNRLLVRVSSSRQ